MITDSWRENEEYAVDTLAWGTLLVWAGNDSAGNKRLFPRGAASLDRWRDDPRRIPPWVLPDDLQDPDQWSIAWNSLKGIDRINQQQS